MFLFVLTLSCRSGKDELEPMPDFELVDVNPNSFTNGESVSPRDHLDKASVWYFGHST